MLNSAIACGLVINVLFLSKNNHMSECAYIYIYAFNIDLGMDLDSINLSFKANHVMDKICKILCIPPS